MEFEPPDFTVSYPKFSDYITDYSLNFDFSPPVGDNVVDFVAYKKKKNK